MSKHFRKIDAFAYNASWDVFCQFRALKNSKKTVKCINTVILSNLDKSNKNYVQNTVITPVSNGDENI